MTAPETSLCRDCGEIGFTGQRCPACHHRRVLNHPELFDLSIAHIDCDAFYAAIEKRDNPDLRDRPVIIGGGQRGVVSTACYVARIHGIHSAMPMFKALKACPDAVVIKPDMAKYVAVGRQIRGLMEGLTPLVEPLSIDEAFVDLSGTERAHHAPPAAVLAAFACRIEAEIGISISIGLAGSKFLAKMASDMDKPRGFKIIGNGEALKVLAVQPVGRIWGVGKAMRRRLERDGFPMIADLQRADRNDLFRRYGTLGFRLYDLSHNIDTRLVSPERATKSVSSETTFHTDLTNFDALDAILWDLSDRVSRRMKKSGLSGRTITVKLKTADFKSRTRSRRLDAPTQIADRIHRTGRDLLEPEADGTPFRLIGISVSDLCRSEGVDGGDLLDPGAARRAAAERAGDAVRNRFGTKSLQKGLGFKPLPPKKPDQTP